jgi:hypothetical protein
MSKVTEVKDGMDELEVLTRELVTLGTGLLTTKTIARDLMRARELRTRIDQIKRRLKSRG